MGLEGGEGAIERSKLFSRGYRLESAECYLEGCRSAIYWLARARRLNRRENGNIHFAIFFPRRGVHFEMFDVWYGRAVKGVYVRMCVRAS